MDTPNAGATAAGYGNEDMKDNIPIDSSASNSEKGKKQLNKSKTIGSLSSGQNLYPDLDNKDMYGKEDNPYYNK